MGVRSKQSISGSITPKDQVSSVLAKDIVEVEVPNEYTQENLLAVIQTVPAIRRFLDYTQEDEATALLDLVGNHNATNIDATHIAGEGFTNGGINTNYNADADGVWETQMGMFWIKDFSNVGTTGSRTYPIQGIYDWIVDEFKCWGFNYGWISFPNNGEGFYQAVAPLLYPSGDPDMFIFKSGASNQYNFRETFPADVHIIIQWTGTYVELFVNGRKVMQYAQSNGSRGASSKVYYDLSTNGNPISNNPATLSISANGDPVTDEEAFTLYEACRDYMFRAKEASVISDIPSTWDEMVSAYGIGYNYPQPSGQAASYRTGDCVWVEQNIFTPAARAANGLKPKQSLADYSTLNNNNAFGNTNRFTDSEGLQDYGATGSAIADYVIDHYTGLGWYSADLGTSDWNTSIDDALASTQGGFDDWFKAGLNQIMSIYRGDDAGGTRLAPEIFPAFNFSYGVSDTSATSTATFLVYNLGGVSNFLRNSLDKTNPYLYKICRKHY